MLRHPGSRVLENYLRERLAYTNNRLLSGDFTELHQVTAFQGMYKAFALVLTKLEEAQKLGLTPTTGLRT